MAPDEEYQLTPAGRRERIGQIVRLVKKYRVWDNLTPVRLRRLLEELGPMFVKMGQILANRSEILPQRFCDELRRLRSDVEPVPYEVVLRCLEEEYGLRLGEMFDAIDPNPLGSASLAPGAPRPPGDRRGRGRQGAAPRCAAGYGTGHRYHPLGGAYRFQVRQHRSIR